MMKKMMNKVMAVLMMGLVFLSPLSSSALAAPKGGMHNPPRQERQMQRHETRMSSKHAKSAPRQEISRVPAHRRDSRDDSGALIGGLILGVILGAAIADANAN